LRQNRTTGGVRNVAASGTRLDACDQSEPRSKALRASPTLFGVRHVARRCLSIGKCLKFVVGETA
jgi:hypothetical protein